MAKKKLAIFDFCGTIFKFQSPDMYADYIAGNTMRAKFLQFLCGMVIKSDKYSVMYHKKLKLFKIKGTSQERLTTAAKEFVNNTILKNLIDDVVVELDKYIADPGYDVVIASAGYNIYLEEFCRIKNIRYLIATDIEVKNGAATGKIDGIDCFGPNKITKLKNILDLGNYDLQDSICFSDSMTDKPIFDLVGNKIFVKEVGNKHTLTRI
jgi:HAD superfamily hydrolase (TIGR01490 family)